MTIGRLNSSSSTSTRLGITSNSLYGTQPSAVVPVTPDEYVRNPAWPALPTVLATDEKFVGLYAVYPDASEQTIQTNFTCRAQDTYYDNYSCWLPLDRVKFDSVLTPSASISSIVDAGPRPKTVLLFGNAQLSSTTQTTAINGNAALILNGTTAYMTLPTHSDFQMTGDFTIEFNTYSTVTGRCVFSTSSDTRLENGSLYLNGVEVISGLGEGSLSTLQTIGISRSGSTVRFYRDYVLVASGTYSGTVDFSGCNFGRRVSTNNSFFSGRLDNIKITKDVAIFTGSLYLINNNTGYPVQIDWGDGSTLTYTTATQSKVYDYNNSNLYSHPSLPYKIATVVVTCSLSSGRLSTITPNLWSANGWLDICFASNSLAGIKFADPRYIGQNMALLEQIRIVHTRLLSTTDITASNPGGSTCDLFSELAGNAQTLALPNLKKITIESAPLLINAREAFRGLTVKTVSLGNLPRLETAVRMFEDCGDLTNVSLGSTPSLNTTYFMFSGCNKLKSVPLFDTSSVTDMQQMFGTCYALEAIPEFNTGNVTVMSSMFSNCESLTTIPLLNTGKVTVMNSMFNGCNALRAIPLLNTEKVTTIETMFTFCSKLESIPLLNTAATITVRDFANGCAALNEIPALNFSAVNSAVSSFFAINQRVSKINWYGLRYSHTIANLLLQATALNTYYTNLGTAVGSQTLIVTNNPGVTADDPSIAVSKGWTVTGS